MPGRKAQRGPTRKRAGAAPARATRPAYPPFRMEAGGDVPVTVLLEVLCAVHLSALVESPFRDRGGFILVGPPGIMKSTMIELLDVNYSDTLLLSDINNKGLSELKQQIANDAVRTIIFPEYPKLYERNPYTAANVEGTIRALASEGFSAAAFEDSTIAKLKARATIIAAMGERFRMMHSKRWEENGFARRFLWGLFKLKRPDLLEAAVDDWKLVDFQMQHVPLVPTPPVIPNLTTREERSALRFLLKYQPTPHSAQAQLLAKVLSVLKWWQRLQGKPMDDAVRKLQVFARCLGPNGAELVL